MIKKIIVLTFSLLGVIALLIAVLEPSKTATILCLVYFAFALLEEKTDLIAVKVASRAILLISALIFTFLIIFLVILIIPSNNTNTQYDSMSREELQAEVAKYQTQEHVQDKVNDNTDKHSDAINRILESLQPQIEQGIEKFKEQEDSN